MVKLYYICVLYKDENNRVNNLKLASDLSAFRYFQRNSFQEFIKFTTKLCAERSEKFSRSSIKEKEYFCHIYVRGDGLTGAIISDNEYPHRVAHTLISRVLEEFAEKVPSHSWPTTLDNNAAFTALDAYLTKYQNPMVDPMVKIQKDLDETKIILYNNITSILQRQENLDELVAKSEDLTTITKGFYKTARNTNQCCHLL